MGRGSKWCGESAQVERKAGGCEARGSSPEMTLRVVGKSKLHCACLEREDEQNAAKKRQFF